MAQVGQTTQSGGREWSIHPQSATTRRVVIPVNCTLNFIGAWLRESTTPNANDCRGFLLTNAGALLYETAILTAGITSTSFAHYQLNFSGQSVSAGTYIIGVSGGPDVSGAIIHCGQNDSTGLPTFLFAEDPVTLFPDMPADVSTNLRYDSARQWDIYLDYTEAAAGGGVVLGQLQTHGDCFL